MSTAEYGRRAAAPSPRGPGMPGICSETSAEYNPLFKSQELPSTSILAASHRGVPRPLEWHVGAATAAGSPPAHAASTAQWGTHSTHTSSAGPSMLQQQPAMSKAVGYDRMTFSTPAMGPAAMTAAGPGGTAGLPASSTGIPAANKHNVSASSVTDRPVQVPARPSVVLGAEVAGYKSVITKNPVSPSGYSIAQPEDEEALPSAAPLSAPAFAGRTSGSRSSAAQPRYTQSLIAVNTDMPNNSTGNSHLLAAGPCSSSSTAAAAAAAALAALGNRGKINSVVHTSTAVAAPAAEMPAVYIHSSYNCSNRMADYSSADVSAADAGVDQHSSWASAALQANTGPVALKWNVQEHPASYNLQQPVAGRKTGNNSTSRNRTAAVNCLGTGLEFSTAVELDPAAYDLDTSSGGGYAPSSSRGAVMQQKGHSPRNYTNNNGSDNYAAGAAAAAAGGPGARPPSQQLSEGLSKLKLLSSARLASRLTTPPGSTMSTADMDGIGNSNARGSSSARIGDNLCKSNAVVSGSSGYSSSLSGRPHFGTISQQPQQLQQERHGCIANSSSSAYTPSTGVRRTNSRGRTVGGPAATADIAGSGVSGFIQQASGKSQNDAGFGSQFGAGSSCTAGDSHVARRADEGQYEQQGPLQPCPNCRRSFNASALQRHAKVCAKVFCEKRKVFNVQSQRLQGSEAAKFTAGSSTTAVLGRASSNNNRQQQRQQRQQLDNRPAVSAAAAKKSKWQQQSEQLRAAMRANHSSSGGSAAGCGGPMPSAPEDDNRIPCPHCGRRFAELAAERHIPKCSEIRAKPTGLKAGGGKAAYMRSNSRR